MDCAATFFQPLQLAALEASRLFLYLYRRRPNSRLILVTGRISEAVSFGFLQLGVKGFVTQKDLAVDLPRAVMSVAGGGLWIPRTVLSKFLAYTLASSRSPERSRGSSAPQSAIANATYSTAC